MFSKISLTKLGSLGDREKVRESKARKEKSERKKEKPKTLKQTSKQKADGSGQGFLGGALCNRYSHKHPVLSLIYPYGILAGQQASLRITFLGLDKLRVSKSSPAFDHDS